MKDGIVKSGPHGRTHYLEAGSGPVVILMHSNGNSAYEYEDVLPILAKDYRVIAVDYPGHGDSEPLKHHYTVGDYADFIIAFMDALDVPKASVLGSSIGGAVAIDLGVRHASRIEKLFVVESPIRTPEQWLERWPATEKGYGTVVQTMEQVRPRLRNLTEPVLERWNIDRSKAGAWAMMSVMWSLREYDVFENIPKIKASTMAIYGSKSPHPLGLSTFEKMLPGAARAQMPDCGHFPMMDDPAELSRLVDSFIKG
ncbi:MAG: alpha/beta hydrolase [Hyphomicrobiales bacterium]|nr:alpha/beta hydrolase [Hyphomicrobiales bacterium]